MTAPAIPEHLRKYQEQQDAADAQSLADSGNPTIPRLSIKGQKFRWVQGEEESKKFNQVDVIVVGVDPEGGRMNKAFYEGAYDPSNPSPPDCSSINGVVPDKWVTDPKASVCARCPNNAFGSAVNAQGQRTKGKACKDSKWLWVIKLEEIAEESPTVWCLGVPASSLKALSKFGREVNKTKMPLHVIHVRIELDEDFDYPVLDLQIAGYLDEAGCIASEEVHTAQPWRELVGDTSVPVGALSHQKAEGNTLIERDPKPSRDGQVIPQQTDAGSGADAVKPQKSGPTGPETTSPDAAVENW